MATRSRRAGDERAERRAALLDVYRRLRARFGAAGWWPGESGFEVCVGAILTQNTAWTNVEKALEALRRRGLLAHRALARLPPSRLGPLIRSAGTWRVKARRVAAFVRFLEREYGGRVEAMRGEEPRALRAKLLTVPGVGPETADSIALYAVGLPLFVIDAYTRRVFGRLGVLRGGETYDEAQRLFEASLGPDPALFNDYHAQIVRLAKEHCRVRPLCGECPLEPICARRGVVPVSRVARRSRRSVEVER